MNFETTILEGNGSKVARLVRAFFFRKQDNMGFVDGPKVGKEVVEAREGFKKGCFDQVPIPLEESGAKTIRTRARVIIHGEEGSSNLFKGERADKSVSLRGG